MREPGQPPKFDDLIAEIERARKEWILGDHERAERILKVVASRAYAEAAERPDDAPVPEANSASITSAISQ